MVPLRVFLFSFLVTLLTFAVSLLLSITGIAIVSKLRGVAPDFRLAYRNIALPVGAVVGMIVLVLSAAMEIRHYRQAKALSTIERAG